MSNNENGQSTIEFIFTFAFGVSVVLLIFNSAMNYSAGYLVHYATFMASRTYLTAEAYNGVFNEYENSLSIAEQSARATFNKYELGIFDVPPSSLQFNRPGDGDYLMVGAYATFSKPIDALGKVTGQTTVDLVSESFLGKEPTRAVCAGRVCSAVTGGDSCDETMDITLFDNGC
jgi:hypothetical protein